MASHHPQSPKPVAAPRNLETHASSLTLQPCPCLRRAALCPLPLGSSSEARFFPTGKHTHPALCLYEALCVCLLVAQLCPTLCDPMDCKPPGSSVHGIKSQV